MATFRLLPSGNWNAQVRVKGKSPQSKTFSTKAEAESWANHLEAVTVDRKHHTICALCRSKRPFVAFSNDLVRFADNDERLEGNVSAPVRAQAVRASGSGKSLPSQGRQAPRRKSAMREWLVDRGRRCPRRAKLRGHGISNKESGHRKWHDQRNMHCRGQQCI